MDWDHTAFVARARKAIALSGRPEADVLRDAQTSSIFLQQDWSSPNTPSMRVIVRLARVLRVDPGWLAFGKPGVEYRRKNLEELRTLVSNPAALDAIDRLLFQLPDE